jgi:hypothetical protein
MFASPVANTYETLYQQALDREMIASLDSGWDLCCCFEGYSVPGGVKQLWGVVYGADETFFRERNSRCRDCNHSRRYIFEGYGAAYRIISYRGLDIHYISPRQISMLL